MRVGGRWWPVTTSTPSLATNRTSTPLNPLPLSVFFLDEVVHMCQIVMMWHRVGRCDMADGPQIIWRQVEKRINLK